MIKQLSTLVLCVLLVGACANKKKASEESGNDFVTEPIKHIAIDKNEATLKSGLGDTPENTTKINRSIDTLAISIKRSACYGSCPVYAVNIYGSGYAEYLGKNFVDKKGVYIATLSETDMAKIYAKAIEIDFFKLDERYDNPGISDIPSTTITINTGEKKHQVLGRYDVPQVFQDLGILIDEVVNNQSWQLKP